VAAQPAQTQAFLLDISRCIGCQACVAACKTGNEQPAGTQYIRISEQVRGDFPDLQGNVQNHRCYHCADAACVQVCPTGALFKEAGLTRLNRAACSGCAYCVDACPFDVPRMVDGRCSKCDGCATVVQAGGTPWCVKTCPSDALRFGDREAILAEARSRVAAIQVRYPNARVYGETEAGGLGVVMVLPDAPEVLELPPDPSLPLTVRAWQRAVQPASLGLTALSVLATGFSFIVARRNHLREMKAVHAAEQPAEAATPADAATGAKEK
jgi:formate dehydrogenase iron-sulfur subunit